VTYLGVYEELRYVARTLNFGSKFDFGTCRAHRVFVCVVIERQG
jgi:hypothetical protein